MKSTTSYQKTEGSSSAASSNPFFGQSECLDIWLHRFQLVEQFEDGVMERCEICGQEEFFPVIDGQIDNQNYLSFHARQALMPQHELFKHEYPEI